MKNEYKPHRIIDGYFIKPQLHGLFKIVEYSHMNNSSTIKKRTLYKNLILTTAEDLLYKLEAKL